MLSFTQVSESIQEVLLAVSQEIFALTLFATSFFFFKYLNDRRDYRLPSKVIKQACFGESSPTSHTAPSSRNRAGSGLPSQQQQRRAQEGEAQILALLEVREFTAALNAYRTFEREGLDRLFTDEAMYAGFIQSAVRVGKIDVVERMLRLMIRNRVEPSMDFWHSTLKMLSSRKHYSACIVVYNAYGNMLPNDKVIFSCLINAALENGEPERASSMLGRYVCCDLDPVDYVTAFRTYVAIGDSNAAEKLVSVLGPKMTPLMLNLALLACINATQPERAMNLLLKAHRFEAIEAGAAKGIQIVDTISYNTVIKGFVVSGDMEHCLQCLENMRTHNLVPDDVTLTSLLEISLTEESGKVTDQLVEMLLETGLSRSMDVGTCNHFIKILLRVDKLKKAMEVYQGIKNSNSSQPSIVTYSMLIKALVDAHDMERALLIVEDMSLAGVPPDEIVFSHLLEGCRLVGNHALGERLFEDMLVAGVRPTEYTLTMMVKLHGRCSAHEKAYKLVESWEAKFGKKPSVIHYTCVMSGCLRGKSYGLAWAAYLLMEKNGVSPDEMLMSTLIPAMVYSQAFDRVLHLARRALRYPRGIKVPAATLNTALTQMQLAPGAEEQAQEMKLLMQAAGVAVRSGNMSGPFTRQARPQLSALAKGKM
jgi:pentatricopeptide repeat protein